MKDGPDIARVAALIGDPARANMLVGLMDGRALTASELAAQAGVTKQTASAHLAKLTDAGLLAHEVQGRHKYFRLEDADVAGAIEALMGVAQRRGGKRVRTGPNDPEMRKARICYDHLAGDLGVFAYDQMIARKWLARRGEDLALTTAGDAAFAALGAEELAHGARRPSCRACLDWSERRHHLAGAAGKAMLARLVSLRWASRKPGTRVIRFSTVGERRLREWLER